MRHDDWRRYAAPAAFLLAATVAIVLVRSGLDAGGSAGTSTSAAPTVTRKRVAETTTKTKRRPTTTSSSRAFWVVEAGDTFLVISDKTGVPVSTIQRLNPNVTSTSLFIGEKIRLR